MKHVSIGAKKRLVASIIRDSLTPANSHSDTTKSSLPWIRVISISRVRLGWVVFSCAIAAFGLGRHLATHCHHQHNLPGGVIRLVSLLPSFKQTRVVQQTPVTFTLHPAPEATTSQSDDANLSLYWLTNSKDSETNANLHSDVTGTTSCEGFRNQMGPAAFALDGVTGSRTSRMDIGGKADSGILANSGHGSKAVAKSSLEALVHPALLAHENPRRVLLITASAATVPLMCEVLKHETVEQMHVLAFQSEPPLQQSVPTNATAPTQTAPFVCGGHDVSSRASITWDAWSGDKLPPLLDINMDDSNEAAYDVILVEALPSAVVHSGSFVAACFNSLEPSGILVKQVKAIGHHVMFHTIQYLERAGYPTIVDYIVHDGGTSRLLTRHSSSRFVVAMKNSDSRARWLRNEAEIKLDIARRSHHIPSRESVFQFDGATMTQYQFTSRVVEEAWCAAVVGQPSDDESANNKKWCADGHGYNPDTVTNIPASSLAVRPSRVANGGRGVFTTEFIRQGSALAVEEYVHMIFVPSVTVSLMNQATEYVDTSISKFWAVTNQAYIQGYGFSCWDYGPMAAGVEPGIMSFVNHGCNGTYNTATRWDDHEGTIALGQGAPTSVVAYERDTALAYDPWAARHFPSTPDDLTFAAYDLTAGTELLDNYLVFGGIDDLEEWDDNLLVLKTMCTPGGLGSVSLYEAALATGGSSMEA